MNKFLYQIIHILFEEFMRRKIIAVFFILLFLGTTVSPCFYANALNQHQALTESSEIVLENFNCFLFGIFTKNPPTYRDGFYPIRLLCEYLTFLTFDFVNKIDIDSDSSIFIKMLWLISFLLFIWTFDIRPFHGNLRPLAIQEDVYFGNIERSYDGITEYKYENPLKGYIWTWGESGTAEYMGEMVGKLGIRKMSRSSWIGSTYLADYWAIENFTGIHTKRVMVGICSHIKIGSSF